MSPLDEALFVGALVYYLTDFKMLLIVFLISFTIIFTSIYAVLRRLATGTDQAMRSVPFPLWLNTFIALAAILISMLITMILA